MSTSSVQAPNTPPADNAIPSVRAINVCRRLGWVCGLVTAAAGALTVFINFIEYRRGSPNRVLSFLAGQFRENETETALSTGLAFFLCGTALALLAQYHHMLVKGKLARLAIWLVVLWSAYDLAAYAIDGFSEGRMKLYTDADWSWPFNDPPMSPFTALITLNAGLAILFVAKGSARLRNWSSRLALVIAVLSGIVLLGYAHRVELLSELLGTPVALYTALIFAVLSLGLVCAIGPNHFPIRVFLGVRTQARLLRTFLPVVLGIVLFDALLRSYLEGQEAKAILDSSFAKAPSLMEEDQERRPIQEAINFYPDLPNWRDPLDKKPWNNLTLDEKWKRCLRYAQSQRNQKHSLVSSGMALLSVLVVIVAISYTSRIIGNTIDAAERSRDQALREVRASRDEAEAANERLRKNNEELRRARDAAETAVRTKGRFLANMNHELRTPLNSIILYAEEVMVEHEGDPALVADLQVILDRGKHLITLINDILDYTKLEENRVKLEPTSFPVPDMARDVAITIEPLAKQNGNKLCVQCPHEVGILHADVVRVKQCLLNLLGNANKFTTNGTITLTINREEVEGRYWIIFRVTDTGIGMTPEQQGQIFQLFVQVDSSNTRRAGGTGLGLSISRRLSELMGGSLVLERSEPNVGSTFTMRLPVGAPPTAVALRRIPAVLKPTPGETPTTILVIDDDSDVREMLFRQLSKEGFQVTTCGNGEEALRLAREKHPQVITLDVMMPGMDGWSVLSALKSDPATVDIPVVIVSIIDDKNLGYALGASDYLVKPVPGDRLADVLKRFCDLCSTGLALIAEDDPNMRELLRRVLEKEMWTVVEANDGREALDLMAQRRPSLILLDLMMPEMDGMEFLAELQHHPEWSNIPVVIITAKELSEEERMFLNGSLLLSNCVKRILKKGSFNREELLSQVRQLVARGASVGNNR